MRYLMMKVHVILYLPVLCGSSAGGMKPFLTDTFCVFRFRDLTNGYLVAEVFSWYFPQEIQMHMYNNGTSLDSKLRNWSLLKNVGFFKPPPPPSRKKNPLKMCSFLLNSITVRYYTLLIRCIIPIDTSLRSSPIYDYGNPRQLKKEGRRCAMDSKIFW